jgi:hypothetical protein
MNLSPGLQLGHIEISDYPITYDNSYYINYSVQPELNALAIYSSSYRNGGVRWLRALFSNDDYVRFDEMSLENLIISRLSEYNAIFILNVYELSSGLITELTRLADNGTTIIFFPEQDGNIVNYNEFLSRLNANQISRFDTTRQLLGGIEWKHPVYSQAFREAVNDIDFPEIKGSFIFSSTTRITETPLLWFRNEAKALSTQTVNNGNLVVFSFPLSEQNVNFARHLLFVPTLYSLVINSLARQKLSYTIGVDNYASLPFSASREITSYTVQNPENQQSFIPPITTSAENNLRINLSENFGKAGHYRVFSGNEEISAISLNYDRRESDLRYYNFNELTKEVEAHNLINTKIIQNQEGHFSEVFDEINTGKKLWKWFVMLALLFIATEVGIARFWK